LTSTQQPRLRIQDVTKTFPGVTALADVTFDVHSGRVHGICGENGAGKSTLMAIISGALSPDHGTIEIDGAPILSGGHLAQDLGVAIVRQEPALLPDLTVAENMYLKTREADRPNAARTSEWCREHLAAWNPELPFKPETRVSLLTADLRFIVEVVSALASKPKLLILDEPTEHLAEEDVERLFKKVRSIAGSGSAVIYISHRIREVKDISDVITVLRDGRLQGTHPTPELDERDIVRLIIGRDLEATFPPKPEKDGQGPAPRLEARSLSGRGYNDVSLTVAPGEIVGLAGIDGNGQRETLRALAGLHSSRGTVLIDGREVNVKNSETARRSGVSFVAGDRKNEGMLAELSVGDNIAFRNLGSISTLGFVVGNKWDAVVGKTIDILNVKTPSADTTMASLSGGNQQKAVLGGTLASEPSVLLIDEPTQGVDVGSKAEIYSDLRRRAEQSGTAIVMTSSYAQELVGLCDRVCVFSRGSIIAEFSGEDLTESAITGAALTASSSREKLLSRGGKIWRWLASDAAPFMLIAMTIVLLTTFVALQNEFYLSPFSISSLLALTVPMIFVALGQSTVMMSGGIDLSMGPMMGLILVTASFWLTADNSLLQQSFGWLLLPLVSVMVGLTNWFLSERLALSPLIATLSTYFAIQSISLVLRPSPGGVIDSPITSTLSTQVLGIPVLFVAAVLVAGFLHLMLKRTRFGMSLRAVGSDENHARLIGVNVGKTRLLAYVVGSLIAGCGAVALLAIIGTGDPTAGVTYTLFGISAAVIGGVSIFGGRGSYLGAMLAAILVQQLTGAIPFLGLSQAWQNFFMGGLTIIAVAIFSKARQLVEVK
jgi:ribose transport system ATP-binding protein